MIKKIICALCILTSHVAYGKVYVKNVTPQTSYAATLLNGKEGKQHVSIEIGSNGEAEGFTLVRKGKKVRVIGNDGAGAIYGVNKLLELLQEDPTLSQLATIHEVPQMKLRGACVGLQKTVYLLLDIGFMSIPIHQRTSLGFMTNNSGYATLTYSQRTT